MAPAGLAQGASAAAIPFVDLQAQYRRIKSSVDARIARILDHGRFILGPEVAELEAALARFAGGGEAVGVASGTEALRLPLMAEGIGLGDAVFLPAFTFTATAEVPVAIGASPVFVDVEAASFNLDPASLERAIADVKRAGRLKPRAVIVVDLFGLPADYARIAEICQRENLFLLADAAQSFGARLGNVRVGCLAPATAASFFPSKPLGCYGDGGAILTGDPERAAVYRSLRMHGAGADRYDIVRIGTNARLDTIQAAVLLAKLEIFADELASRERVARTYDRLLAGKVGLPPRHADAASAWAQYCILIDARDRVKAELEVHGVPSAIYYPKPLHLQPAYARYGDGEGSLPVAEQLCERILALPMHPYLDEPTIGRIAATVAAAVAAGA
ncbi:MAG: DegT/DnrJ/EryC1/StrS family aminotransferase [Rhodospirillales bacterium]|nr:DegT/DnrJ/EryC1/StrS family aminotransferase [Rhodospirillales bacterium]